jgi:hypothetical protein
MFQGFLVFDIPVMLHVTVLMVDVQMLLGVRLPPWSKLKMVVSSSSTHLYVSGILHSVVVLKTVMFSALSCLAQVSIVFRRLLWNRKHFLVHPVTHFVFNLYNFTSLCEFLCFYSFNSVPVCTLSFTFCRFFQFLLVRCLRLGSQTARIFSCLRASSRC